MLFIRVALIYNGLIERDDFVLTTNRAGSLVLYVKSVELSDL